MITGGIRDEIIERASAASSRTEICNLIFDSIVAAGLDWREVPLEDVKSVLVLAVGANAGQLRAAA